ncbi:PhzF family phenazine biosynthesis protein [Diaphorobacter ruginosibacter]|uniref:PhzF family phenazine biosynthesis protein n=1 Tax=Diaphorobacter ruginosibacter TaxID=1715720 RepID=A0A7G9RNR0_9BURK|nr:PhzF family phenazine biosynthesis protein [Diaphorobacter ruginosibacter]QNN57235.1 PhzF family phenazine biosynthesis protein [Diaphorobacter ruginosibacter]
MRQRRFMQIDVFSSTPFRGNPLAVVVDAEGLSDAEMQNFARWTNLSETTFLLPPSHPDADYQVRIFTPSDELPFAGHPTLGSCHAWLTAGGKPRSSSHVVQQCKKGLVRIRMDADNTTAPLAFAAPDSTRHAVTEEELAPVLQALGLERAEVGAHSKLDNGPLFWALLVNNPDRLLELQPDCSKLYAMGVNIGIAAPYPQENAGLIGRASREARAFARSEPDKAATPDLEVRVFFDATTTSVEDPITGSFNASLAQWLIEEGHIRAPYIAAQGTCLDRDGIVEITQDEHSQVWVGGASHTCISGTITI